MLSRRTIFKAIATLPFAFFTNINIFSRSRFELHLPKHDEYSVIDYAITKYINTTHCLRLKMNALKIPREYMQLYSNVYKENSEQFLFDVSNELLSCAMYSQYELEKIKSIDWKKIQNIIDEQAKKLKVIIWYASYPQSSYSWLDNYLNEHIEEHYQLTLDLKHVASIRHSAQTRHFINHESQPMFFTINGVTMNTVDVAEWIIKWEGKLNPFWL